MSINVTAASPKRVSPSMCTALASFSIITILMGDRLGAWNRVFRVEGQVEHQDIDAWIAEES